MSDFFTVSKEDLVLPPSFLIFEPGTKVTLTIEDFKEDKSSKPKLTITTRVLTGEHEGQQHLMVIRKAHKKGFVNFMTAFFNKEDILAGNIKPSSLIGKTFNCTAEDIREFNGREYQDLVGIREIDNNSENTEEVPGF